MTQPSRLHLFQAFGIELEYMIVDKTTLEVRPIADQLLKHVLGQYGGDYEHGIVTWSNELVLHVIEIKSTRPESNFNNLVNAFADDIRQINAILAGWNAILLPSAAHPLMDPLTQTRLWPHDNNEVYDLYNKIFDCRGHGWSNLQSTHLNLPFYDDEEFAKLHAAVRLVLPILPALCASSPILDGASTGMLDTRMRYYRTNQAAIPSITGKVIPEGVFSKRQYFNSVYEKIRTDISPHDPGNILDPIWVNSRGAIPRFDRGSIEIRVMDIQECPQADLAIQSFVIETIKALVGEKFCPLEVQMKAGTDMLSDLLDATARTGRHTRVESSDFAQVFGLTAPCTVNDIWTTIFTRLQQPSKPLESWKPEIEILLQEGCLSERLLKHLNHDFSRDSILRTWRTLADCLEQNRMLL